jgi:hypothetical protein
LLASFAASGEAASATWLIVRGDPMRRAILISTTLARLGLLGGVAIAGA